MKASPSQIQRVGETQEGLLIRPDRFTTAGSLLRQSKESEGPILIPPPVEKLKAISNKDGKGYHKKATKINSIVGQSVLVHSSTSNPSLSSKRKR